MIVVSDTSPLTALLTGGGADPFDPTLRRSRHPRSGAPRIVARSAGLPAWAGAAACRTRRKPEICPARGRGRSRGHRAGFGTHADRLLIDERKGRKLAIQEGVAVIGLLGVVLLARRKVLIPSARTLVERLDREAGMYLRRTLETPHSKRLASDSFRTLCSSRPVLPSAGLRSVELTRLKPGGRQSLLTSAATVASAQALEPSRPFARFTDRLPCSHPLPPVVGRGTPVRAASSWRMIENSPAFQRWVRGQRATSPEDG